ncbi:FAD-dependent oxidoreductase [Candidatus Saccharibacteria bacterium]|nr:MAG: FAD-dependent oxidoreductase [Candidatus Saccharibacteria bacterium]
MKEDKKLPRTKLVVVGGGFAGVRAAIELGRQPHLKVTLVTETLDFTYYPTLYETATGGSSEQSSIPLEQILADDPVQVIVGKATSLDSAKNTLTLEGNKTPISYDKLVLALGTVTNYFGISGLAEYSYSIKSVYEAERFKRHLHAQLIAEHEPDLNYIIVGGGATGIELAGSLGDYLRETMAKHGLPERPIHIDLVEAMPHLMPRLPKPVGKTIERRLRKLGVRLYLNSKVEGASAQELTVSGKPIRSHTIVWTAGAMNNPFFTDNNFVLSDRKKVVVDEFLRAEGQKNIFVLGDNAETPFSGMAQTALYDADFIAHNFRAESEDRPKLAYRPMEPAYVTPVGANWASLVWKDVHLHGRLAYWLRNVADLKGFAELLPAHEATVQWSSTLDRENLCPICS